MERVRNYRDSVPALFPVLNDSVALTVSAERGNQRRHDAGARQTKQHVSGGKAIALLRGTRRALTSSLRQTGGSGVGVSKPIGKQQQK